jgi:hypothetical protein
MLVLSKKRNFSELEKSYFILTQQQYESEKIKKFN